MTVIKNVSDLSRDLGNLFQEKFTGEIALGERDRRVTIHLYDGRVLYVIDNFHPVRRWLRAIEKHCAQNAIIHNLAAQKKLTSYQQLSQALSRQQISLTQAKAIISEIAKECFFELFAQQNLLGELTWKTDRHRNTEKSLDLSLIAEQTQLILLEAEKLQQKWHNANLANYMPTLSPVLEQEQKYKAVEIPIPAEYLQGNDTFWDIAAKTQTSLLLVARSLIHLKQQNILKLEQIPDIPGGTNGRNKYPTPLSSVSINREVSTTAPSVTTKSKSKTNQSSLDNSSTYDRLKPLIACIDDSPVLCHSVQKILTSVGYQSLIIREPMTGMGLLVKHRPNLIFLDLLMPTVNGYSVCKFLRETNFFKTTPIIILTSKDTIVDRTRAKLAGATDFLSKPPETQELLQVIRQYITDISLG
jgi:two-component system, chemotaxis family, response regulator PixG